MLCRTLFGFFVFVNRSGPRFQNSRFGQKFRGKSSAVDQSPGEGELFLTFSNNLIDLHSGCVSMGVFDHD